MRLRNILVLCAFTAMSVGMISCGKKADDASKPDSTAMAPAPAPAPTPAPAAAPMADTSKKMMDGDKKMDNKGGEMKKK